jgi:RimJ/RimL family protein N-acetyltransferase
MRSPSRSGQSTKMMTRCWAYFSYNKRSIALFEKLGFQPEDAFREFLKRDGKRHDMLLHGLLRPECEARQPKE